MTAEHGLTLAVAPPALARTVPGPLLAPTAAQPQRARGVHPHGHRGRRRGRLALLGSRPSTRSRSGRWTGSRRPSGDLPLGHRPVRAGHPVARRRGCRHLARWWRSSRSLLAAIVGTTAGVAAGYFGPPVSPPVLGVANVLFAFPPLLLALALASALTRTWFTVAVAIAIVYVPIFIRVSRGPVLALRDADFIRASRVLGYSTRPHPVPPRAAQHLGGDHRPGHARAVLGGAHGGVAQLRGPGDAATRARAGLDGPRRQVAGRQLLVDDGSPRGR